jgi:hypothetical protein
MTSGSERPVFDIDWVDAVVSQYSSGTVYRIENRAEPGIFPLNMEDATTLAMEEIGIKHLPKRFHTILTEAAKMCIDNYEDNRQYRETLAKRANWLLEGTELDQQG